MRGISVARIVRGMSDDALGTDFAGFSPTMYMLSAVVYAERDGQILLLKRAEGSALAGQWFLPGGAVDPGERPEEAARPRAARGEWTGDRR